MLLKGLAGVHPAALGDRLVRNERVRNERVYDLCYLRRATESADRHARGELLARIFVSWQRLSALDQGGSYGVDRDAVRRQGAGQGAGEPDEGRLRGRVVEVDEPAGNSGDR